MSFQAYLDTIKATTGKTPDDFKELAKKKGLLEPGVKAGEIVGWLKQKFGLGHGHAMAIVLTLQRVKGSTLNAAEKIEKHFSGKNSEWKKPYENLVTQLKKFGSDISVAPTNTYISLLAGEKKFGIIQAASKQMDIGIKLKREKPTKRFEASGKWNSMVTHRVHISDPKEIDKELLSWLRKAYESVS